MTEIKKYYDTDLIGSGGGYTMTEIEKKAEAYAEGQLTEADSPEWPKLPGFRDNLKDELSGAFTAGAAAVIDLIREGMPGEVNVDANEFAEGVSAGWCNYRSEILKLLDNIK